ncbi:33534_t:CDS:2 [Gigaspora margarita]|uniref:33534_t:CDS:1 n=1 Tax=Gigaspora margarita TaxID=4874 RepID=A0ABN7UV58_GIGMA|nr:33534_t:CDS:2 [Gigaspora margarita]
MFKMNLSLSPNDTYNANIIDNKIFIRESYDDDYWTRYFRKKDIQKLYKLFLEQVIPIAKRIMETSLHPNDEVLYKELFDYYSVITDPSIQEKIDGDCEFFIGVNEIIPDLHFWSTGFNDSYSERRSNIVRHFRYFFVHRCMNNILEKAYDMYISVFDIKIGAIFFLDYLESILELRYENIDQIFVNYVNSLPLE